MSLSSNFRAYRILSHRYLCQTLTHSPRDHTNSSRLYLLQLRTIPMAASNMSASELEGILRRVRSTGDLVEPARSTRRQGGAGRRSEAVTRNRNDWNRRPLDARPAGLSIPDIRAPEPAHRPARLARPGEAWDNEADHAEEPPRNDASRRNTRPPPRGWLGKLMVFLGQAGPNARARSQLISLVWTLSSGTVQVCRLHSVKYARLIFITW